MQFRNCLRNEYGKCDLPAHTIRRIAHGLQQLGLQLEYAPFRVTDTIHWGRTWLDSLRIACEGKGISPELAEASACAELAERLSAGLFYPAFEEQVRFNVPALYDEETRRFLDYEWMGGYVHAHQDDVENPLCIEELLANETHLTDAEIADIKDSRMARHWVDGFSLLREETVKVPINFVVYIHGSNGIAAGNTVEEALIQATCEIIERHVQIHTIRPERTVPTIDPDSVANPLIREMIGFYRANNVEVVLKDLSLEGRLPAVGVLYINKNLPPDRLEHRMLIPGASFNLDEGLTRCFTEGMQGRKTLLAPRPQFDRPVVDRSRLSDHYLLMRCGVSRKDISFLEQGEIRGYRNTRAKDIFSEIEAIKRICRELDTDCILVDHTHPVLDFPVVRVVIPRVSDFLPFLRQDALVSPETRPSARWRGEEYKKVMQSFFAPRQGGSPRA
jgi:YcaO-like protein with predicted kinase domain